MRAGFGRWSSHFMVLSWLVVPVLFWWALKDVSFEQLSDVLRRLGSVQIGLLLLLNSGIFLLFCFRWWWILRAQGYSVPFLTLSRYRLTAFGITYFTPGPQLGGEPYQVLAIHHRHHLPLAISLSAVSLDKLFEILTNFSFLLLGLGTILQTGDIASFLRFNPIVLPAFMLGIPLTYLGLVWAGRLPVSNAVLWLSSRFPRSERLRRGSKTVSQAEAEIANFCKRQPRTLVFLLLESTLIWLLLVAEYWLALRFLGLSFDLVETIQVMTAARMAFLLPIPSAVGTLEAGQVLAMKALGVSSAFGISVSLLIRARDISFGGLGILIGVLGSKERSPRLSRRRA